MNDSVYTQDIQALRQIMKALRTPETGCPWDLAQSYKSIVPYTLEEAYEVADAIERNDPNDLRDELGDLLFQVVFYAQLAEEDGHFAFTDVVTGICDKMIRRHPHVFENSGAKTKAEIKQQWELIKAQEQAAKQPRQTSSPKQGVLDNVPRALPALKRAVKLQNKAAKVGFDWPDLAPVWAKLQEELGELEDELSGLEPNNGPHLDRETHKRATEEMGDVLFVLSNIARHLDIDAEAALTTANEKFIRRFAHIEARLDETGRTPSQSSLDEMDRFWNEARQTDKEK